MILRAVPQGNVIVFELEGHLDFESIQQLEITCQQVIKEQNCLRVIFNMQKLRFVGSSGINQFIQMMKEFNNLDLKPRFCALSSEFQKIFKAFQTSRNPFEIFETIDNAKASFDFPETPRKASAKRRKMKIN